MQKLKNLSSYRPSRSRQTNPENEKNDTTGDWPLSGQNGGVLGGDVDEQPRLTGSEERTSASRKTYSPTSNDFVGGVNIRRATRTRRNAIIVASLCFFTSVIFLILTIIGNTHPKPVLRNTYFFLINISNIIPTTAGDAILVNSLARSLGLHDYYQVGLWNFCEGYSDSGLTGCSHPTPTYWFNPIAIILDELLPGSTIALPAEVVGILSLVRLASHVMTAFFITGCVLNTISIFATPVVILSRWWSLPLSIFTFIGALLTTAAAIIATVMFIIFRNVFTSQPGLNIKASLGPQMFVFMWIAAAFSIVGWLVNAGLCCCGASERDVKTGRRAGNKAAYPGGVIPPGVGKAHKNQNGEGRRRWNGVTEKLPTVFRRRNNADVDT